jgi:hypothetical protein
MKTYQVKNISNGQSAEVIADDISTLQDLITHLENNGQDDVVPLQHKVFLRPERHELQLNSRFPDDRDTFKLSVVIDKMASGFAPSCQ